MSLQIDSSGWVLERIVLIVYFFYIGSSITFIYSLSKLGLIIIYYSVI